MGLPSVMLTVFVGWSLLHAPQQASGETIPTAAYALLPGPQGVQIRIELEIAATPAARTQGLMFRAHLPQDKGMLFVFEDSRKHIFWMKDTRIPLDLLFLDEKGRIVGIVQQAQPFSLEPRGVEQASRFVLEINGGLAQRYQLQMGQTIRLFLPPSPHSQSHPDLK